MIKRTLFFANPAYLSTKNEQLVVSYPNTEEPTRTVPIEDVGIIVLENQQITVTNSLLDRLIQNKTLVVACNRQHLPVGLLMPMIGHTEQTERFINQLNASVPLKKNLWAQTIKAKIANQARLLRIREIDTENMSYWEKSVASGDPQNYEGRAAAYYWSVVFKGKFLRDREGEAPNHLLNYGYAILRAITARALIGSGLLPILGIFHRNKYNALCLADDIMEPYRPFVDSLVCELVDNEEVTEELSHKQKMHLLGIAAMDVLMEGKRSPLLTAMSRTTHSLQECFSGVSRRILYPEMVL